jgi:hypothetical protein
VLKYSWVYGKICEKIEGPTVEEGEEEEKVRNGEI